jgi:hypothetical protein
MTLFCMISTMISLVLLAIASVEVFIAAFVEPILILVLVIYLGLMSKYKKDMFILSLALNYFF